MNGIYRWIWPKLNAGYQIEKKNAMETSYWHVCIEAIVKNSGVKTQVLLDKFSICQMSCIYSEGKN